MAAKRKTRVKDLAKKFGVSTDMVLEEISAEGIKVKGANPVVPEDMLELIEDHLESVVKKQQEELDDSKDSPPNTDGLPEIHLKPPIIVKSLAQIMEKKPNEVIATLMSMNVLASINQAIEPEIAEKLAKNMGFCLVLERREKEEHLLQVNPEDELLPEEEEDDDDPANLCERPPVVTFMGHVDHGKTSLQDMVRKSNVVSGEAGGITQHIGASLVKYQDRFITFIDTPGHEAFTSMRSRGADVTDIVVLVVAANDGFMPQTIEALNHARAANVPIIVAINKMDLPDADAEKVLLHMQQNSLMSENWGGEVGTVQVSAMTGDGIDDLLERILLESELLELKANPKRRAKGVILEAQLEQGLGSTASVLIQNGTLRVGEVVICGEYFGKVKAMLNEHSARVKEAGPSIPVKLVGLSGVPEAGSTLAVCKLEKDARRLSELRKDRNRQKSLVQTNATSADDIFAQLDFNKRNNLQVIIKSDVKGSAEAIIDSFNKLPSEKISVNVILTGVGAITENDVLLASASKALLVGFHVRVNPGVNALAKKEKVEIKLYSVIYELLEDITDALAGRLEPDKREKELGKAKILQIFNLSKGPAVCGCRVEQGTVRVGAKARVFRNNELIFNGEVFSLRRFQDDVKEVRQGMECGIRLDNFLDFQEDDQIQIYDIELKKATLA